MLTLLRRLSRLPAVKQLKKPIVIATSVFVSKELIGSRTPAEKTKAGFKEEPKAPPKKSDNLHFSYENSSDSAVLHASFEEFDQTQGKGWRVLADKRHYKQAGCLIDKYIQLHALQLTPSNIQILTFHAGQMYGFFGDYQIAIERFKCSNLQHAKIINWFEEQGADANVLQAYSDSQQGWKLYVDATLAFLQRDKKRFLEAKSLLEKYKDVCMTTSTGEKLCMNQMNLRVVACLELGFQYGLSYREAYSFNMQHNAASRLIFS